MDQRIEIASATGVDLHLKIAGPGARSYAFVIDWHIRALLALAWFSLASLAVAGSLQIIAPDSPNYTLYVFVALVPPLLITALYHPVLEIMMQGRTPGKRIAGVRIVTLDCQNPSVLAHLVRNVMRLVDSLPLGYAFGLVSCIATDKSVRIGDMAAGTVLVYESDARAHKDSATSINPAAIERYGLEQAELLADVLDRWKSLDPDVRMQLSGSLLRRLVPDQQPGDTEHQRHEELQQLLNRPGAAGE